jgi:CIC family chloride channel protein
MKNIVARMPPVNSLFMALLAFLVGIVGGFGAVAFRGLIAFFHNLLFLGKLSLIYDATVHTLPSPWGPYVILVPVLGAAGVAFLVSNFAPEANGHGVPEVMDAIYYKRGIIRPVVGFVKSLASALSIGSGGSVGREGPIIQIGSSFGSTLGQLVPMATWQRITLIAAGSGAGIAATFNTPIGGLLFAMELMLHEISVRTMVPVAISTATATYIGRVFFGDYPAFQIPELQTISFHLLNPVLITSFLGVGIITGVASALYIRSIYFLEDIFEKKVPGNYYSRHMIGMFLVGILIYLSMTFLGHYYVEGVGYAGIEDILTGRLDQINLLLLLFIMKLLATSLTLGSGASGGIFSPALFLGAMAGGAYGLALKTIFPSLPIGPPVFALAGMAGLVCGSTGAAVTALVMIFEMTLDYNAILPLTVTVAVSNGIRVILSSETIYTLKLARRGHFIPKALQANFEYSRRAATVMDTNTIVLSVSTRISDFARIVSTDPSVSHFLLEEHNRIAGFVTRDAALKVLDESGSQLQLKDVMQRSFVTVAENTTLSEVLEHMIAGGAQVALVVTKSPPRSITDVLGLITKERIAVTVEEAITLFD